MSLLKYASRARRLRVPRTLNPAIPLALGTSFAVTAFAGGCERIGFYSTGRSSAAATTTTTTTGASVTTGGMTATTRASLLEAIASCTAGLYDAFQKVADEFEVAASEAKDDPAAQEKAREAWGKAIDVWQRAELFQFGPAGPSSGPGGEALRDHIYAWPLVSRCLIEQNIVSKAYESESFGASALVNTKGLAAAEYLLFFEGAENACSPASPINASGQWDALSPSDLATRKAHYASSVGVDVGARVRALVNAWSPDGADFRAQLVNAGGSSSVYASDQAALNAVSDAMFYIEAAVKDVKLARPLGLTDCEEATCPEALESRYAGRSKAHIRNNLLGLRMLMVGCDEGEGVGFDDLLISIGAPAVAEKLTLGVSGALAAVDAIVADDLKKALEEDRASVEALHASVKAITDVMKTDFITVLDLELPKLLEGDND
jgi:predicted lipoprotein